MLDMYNMLHALQNSRLKIAHSSLRSKIRKVSRGGAGPKFQRFPSENYVVRVKYQKLAKSV